VIVDSVDEGGVLESATWATLEAMFPHTLRRGPSVTIGNSDRELVDVLAFYEYGTFLLEAKDLSVLSATPTRSRERRVAGTIKQAKKAIGQLIGASKAIRRGERVSDAKGKVLQPTVTQPMHCIVLLTELMHEGEWSVVEHMLREAVVETREYFHLLDLSELIYLAKLAKYDAAHFDYLLMERFRHFVERGSVHIRVRVAPRSSGPAGGS
jgi:hypothetical protein